MRLIPVLYELLTRRPYYTVRSCTAEFGPPPGAVYREQLAAYSDAELLRSGNDPAVVLARYPNREQAANLATRRERQTAA